MTKLLFSYLSFLTACFATEHVLTLKEAVTLALAANPELMIARLDEQKAEAAVRIARDPFIPKVIVGSGLAYSNGFPMSIEGAAPSVFQARGIGSIYNQQQRYALAQARENARGAALDTQTRREDVALRTAALFLDLEQSTSASAYARRQVESLAKVEETVRLRVEGGRELPIEARRAALELARARQRQTSLEANAAYLGSSLAVVLGMSAEDRIRPSEEERSAPSLPQSEEAAVETALTDNIEVRRLESALVAKGLEIRSHRASRDPTLDLVAQYGLFAKFNNYEDFFRRFQRHNGQIGVSFQIPVVSGPASSALASQSDADAARLRLEIGRARNRIALETRKSYQDLRRSAAAREVARLALDVARDQVGILLAQLEEGRASMRQVEEARSAENERWLEFLDARFAFERAQYELLRRTGGLTAALR